MKRTLFLVLLFLFLIGCSSGKKIGETERTIPEMNNSVLFNSPWELSVLNGRFMLKWIETPSEIHCW